MRFSSGVHISTGFNSAVIALSGSSLVGLALLGCALTGLAPLGGALSACWVRYSGFSSMRPMPGSPFQNAYIPGNRLLWGME